MTDEQKTLAEDETKRPEGETPQPIEYVEQPWKKKTYPIVLITETEDQSSDNEEDNIPFSSQIQARKEDTRVVIEEVPSGETCVGKTVVKQFDEGLFHGQVTTTIKKVLYFLSELL
jgi:hypothetical protein